METRPHLNIAIEWLAQSALDEQIETQRRIAALEAEIDALRYQNLALREALAELAFLPASPDRAADSRDCGHA
jgi:hypothetical protein